MEYFKGNISIFYTITENRKTGNTSLFYMVNTILAPKLKQNNEQKYMSIKGFKLKNIRNIF